MSKKIPCLITTDKDKRGVFMGYVEESTLNEMDKAFRGDKSIFAEDIRMCVYWSKAVRGVIGLAATGPDFGSRITKAAPSGHIDGVTAVLTITPEAEKAWLSEPWG